MDSLLNGIMALAFLAGLVLLGFYVAGRMKKDAGAKPRESARTSPGGGGRSSPPPAVPAPGLKAPNPSGPSFEDLVVDLNMAVIAKEICRLRGEGGAAASKQGAAQVAYADLMVRAGDMTLADRILEPADEFISVDDRDLGRMGAGEAGDHLTKTFQKVSAGGLHRFHVRRGAEERVIFVHFPKDAELPGARLVMPEKIRITDELAQEIQKKFFGLGTYYQQTYFTPEERALVAQCLSRSEATPEEYAFLTRRVIREAGPQVNAEQNWFRTRLQALEQAMESAVVPDVVVTGEGRKVIGRILEEAAAHVRVEAEYGRITVYRNDVREVHKSKEIREEFERRLKAAARYPEQAYPELLTWTRDWGLPAHREYVAYLMLLRNPADRLARLAAGYHQGPNGRWEIPVAGAPPPQPAA